MQHNPAILGITASSLMKRIRYLVIIPSHQIKYLSCIDVTICSKA
jgi:hypothetical protein